MILVAGGTGRLGRLVTRRLVSEGKSVRVLTRSDSGETDLAAGVELVTGDVRDPTSLGPAMSGVETVVSAVHGLVGSGGVTPASVDRDGNRNLISASARGSIGVVLMSTIGASPSHPMELFRMKWAAECQLRASGVPWTIVRSSAFAETWIDLLQQSGAGSGRPQVFGRGANPINFVRVQDVADAVVHATLDSSLRGQVIEVGGPANITLNELARLVQASMGVSGPIRHVPRVGLRTMSVAARLFNPTLARLASASLAMDTVDLTFDPLENTRAHPWLSCSPIITGVASAQQ
jgi:uncharacterized protein YbjT (DUF2867 family)